MGTGQDADYSGRCRHWRPQMGRNRSSSSQHSAPVNHRGLSDSPTPSDGGGRSLAGGEDCGLGVDARWSGDSPIRAAEANSSNNRPTTTGCSLGLGRGTLAESHAARSQPSHVCRHEVGTGSWRSSGVAGISLASQPAPQRIRISPTMRCMSLSIQSGRRESRC
jgi:hypothetical protein